MRIAVWNHSFWNNSTMNYFITTQFWFSYTVCITLLNQLTLSASTGNYVISRCVQTYKNIVQNSKVNWFGFRGNNNLIIKKRQLLNLCSNDIIQTAAILKWWKNKNSPSCYSWLGLYQPDYLCNMSVKSVR